jgi:REP element-mobilizing transposase RayT
VTYDPSRHHRRSIRLKGYDYSQAGAYFVTILAQDRARVFGEIVDDAMQLNAAGEMVLAEWDALPSRFPTIELDAFVVMPNHVHGIIVITENPSNVVGAGLVPAPVAVRDDVGATTVGATTDQATTDRATTVGATTVGATTVGATTDGATTDRATTDGATTDGATTDRATTVGATTVGATTVGATTVGATTVGATTDRATTDRATTVGATTVGATTRVAPTDADAATVVSPVAPTVGDVVGAFKSLTTVLYTRGVKQSAWPPFRGRLWQRNYYEHIIRDEAALVRIREYIANNPLQWALDRENPVRAVREPRQHDP